jgi:hypothetical protein
MKQSREEEADLITILDLKREWKNLRKKFLQRLVDANRLTKMHANIFHRIDEQLLHGT